MLLYHHIISFYLYQVLKIIQSILKFAKITQMSDSNLWFSQNLKILREIAAIVCKHVYTVVKTFPILVLI